MTEWTIRAMLEDRAVDRPFDIHRMTIGDDWFALEVVFADIVERHGFGAATRGKEEAVRPFGVTHADMTISIDDAFVRQDVVCSDEITKRGSQIRHGSLPPCRRSGRVGEIACAKTAASGWEDQAPIRRRLHFRIVGNAGLHVAPFENRSSLARR